MKDTESRLYSIWHNMKLRCYNKNNPKYEAYGGKGIGVCAEWRDDFSAFKSWAMKNGYHDPKDKNDAVNSLTLDRIDTSKDYSPSNCRWISFDANRRHEGENKFELKSMPRKGAK